VRERYLPSDVEGPRQRIRDSKGAVVSPDPTCLLCNTALVVDFVFGKCNSEFINILSHSTVHFFLYELRPCLVPVSLEPDAAHVLAKRIDDFRMDLTNLRFAQVKTSADVS